MIKLNEEIKEKIDSSPKIEGDFNLNLEEMAEAGLHFGHWTSKTNPKMKPYIFGVRNTIHLIDLEKTAEKFKDALKFIEDLIYQNKILLFIGTKIQIKELMKNIAKDCGFPYVSERWLGGTFTNFETLQKRIEYFKELERKKAAGDLEKYTKKERADFDKEIRDLEIKFGGIKEMTKLPDAIFICDMKKDETALREAKRKGVKVIGIAHTNIDPTLADYPIPANDDSISSVKYILEKVKEVILNAKLKTQSAKPQPKTES